MLMTPFRTMVVPPPMSAFYLQMSAPVSQVSFCHLTQSSNDIAILLYTGQLYIYTMTQCNVFNFLYYYHCWCCNDIVNSECIASYSSRHWRSAHRGPVVSAIGHFRRRKSVHIAIESSWFHQNSAMAETTRQKGPGPREMEMVIVYGLGLRLGLGLMLVLGSTIQLVPP